jgi:hypothetical protein
MKLPYTFAMVGVIAIGLMRTSFSVAESYPIVGTGQTKCYDNRQEIAPPKKGQPFYGQDAQFPGRAASYALSADELTVQDKVTGLTWQRSPNREGKNPVAADKLTFAQARALPETLNAARFGGFNDWRLPTIKEIYSLIEFSGMDVSGPNLNDTSRQTPFIDTKFFKFVYGDPRAGERTIDSQWASSVTYVANPNQMFGVNFADGRIKGYGLTMPGRGDKTFYVICVRGNPAYGKNDFHDNNDGTISDRATGLMWSKADSAKGVNWQAALAWAQQKNAEKYLGHEDWRLPNIKELQSIVDYSRSPNTSHSAAIDPLFNCTQITNAAGQADYAYYWSSTTHAGMHGGDAAAYAAFGRASGWMSSRGPGDPGEERIRPPPPRDDPADNYRYEDVHGAGAQRSDPKAGDPSAFPHGRGPQGDVIRIDNFVRLVR